jgi:hypothetical protein
MCLICANVSLSLSFPLLCVSHRTLGAMMVNQKENLQFIINLPVDFPCFWKISMIFQRFFVEKILKNTQYSDYNFLSENLSNFKEKNKVLVLHFVSVNAKFPWFSLNTLHFLIFCEFIPHFCQNPEIFLRFLEVNFLISIENFRDLVRILCLFSDYAPRRGGI